MRRPDWWPRLQMVLRDWEQKPFTWGETDCAHFMAACIEATTGADVLGTWRGAYSSRLTFVARLRGRGHRSVETAVRDALAALGGESIDPRAGTVGDVGVTHDGVICVRFPAGWLARHVNGAYSIVQPSKAWAI
jgi:hypothetical protein